MWREDHRLLAKMQGICFSVKEVCYHSICRVEHENIAEATSDVSYNARKLEGKIMNFFGDRIQLVRAKAIRGNLICDKKYTTKRSNSIIR